MEASKYLYQIVNKKGQLSADVVAEVREDARTVKRELEKQLGEKLQIVQYERKTVVR